VSASVARRYAKAVAEIAREENVLDEVGGELFAVASVTADPEIGAALASPLLSPAHRRALMQSIAERLGLRPSIRNFLLLLADQHRLDQLGAIAEHYQRLVDAALGRVRARITSATEISADEQRAVIGALEGLTGKKVIAEGAVDPALLGGIVVEVEGKVYDGSVQTQLERLAAGIAGQHSFL